MTTEEKLKMLEIEERLQREHNARVENDLLAAQNEDFARVKAEIVEYDKEHPEDCTFGLQIYHVRDGERARRTFDHAFYCYELRNVHGARVAVNYLRRWGVAWCGKCAGHWQVRDGRRVVAEA